MTANELRIGNIISRNNKTVSIDCVQERLLGVTLGEYYLIPIKEFKPIELTEEWLIKFGWSYYNGKTSGDLTKDTSCRIDLDYINEAIQVKSHYESKDFYRKVYNCKYVHQLQNLYFALTGQELKLIS